MKMRLLDLVEVVFAMGCGMALVRACDSGRPLGFLGLRYVVEPFLVGLALAGSLTFWWETFARPTRVPWGVGRWTWAIAGSVVFIDLAVNGAMLHAFGWKRGRPASFVSVAESTLGACTSQFYGQVSWLLLVFWIARRFSGMPTDPRPDGRELAGRALLTAVILWGFAYRIDAVANLR